VNISAELKRHFDERKAALIQEAFKAVGQTKAMEKLGIIRGGLREIEEIEIFISQLEKRDS